MKSHNQIVDDIVSMTERNFREQFAPGQGLTDEQVARALRLEAEAREHRRAYKAALAIESAPPASVVSGVSPTEPSGTGQAGADQSWNAAEQWAVPKGDGWLISVVGPSGRELFLCNRDGQDQETECIGLASVYETEAFATWRADYYRALCKARYPVPPKVEAISLQSLRDGPSDRELGL